MSDPAGAAHRADDARRGALVLAVAFGFVFVSRGVADIWMVFLLPIEHDFAATRQQTTGVYSTYMVVSGLSAPLVGLALRRFGARACYTSGALLVTLGIGLASLAGALWHLYVCIGLFVSLGISALGIVPASALIGRTFRRRMSTAMAVAYAGLGTGSLLLVPLAQWSIERQGWRATYAWLGLALAAVAVLTVLLPWRRIAGDPGDASRPSAPAGSTGVAITLAQSLRRPEFAGLMVTFGFTGFGMYVVIVQTVPFLIEIGHTPLRAATLFGMCGMLSIGGVVSCGWLSDRFGLRPIALMSFGLTLAGMLSLLALSYVSAEWIVATFVVGFGLAQGARGPIIATLTNRLFVGPAAVALYGIVYASSMVGAGVGSWASGFLHDWSGSYRPGLALAVAGILVASSPFVLMRAFRAPVPIVPSSD
jgi:predicted MFS family arabinose efflux permease